MNLYIKTLIKLMMIIFTISIIYFCLKFVINKNNKSSSAEISKIELVKKLENEGNLSVSALDWSNKKINSSDFVGRPLILHFWATWCAPCVEEVPRLIALNKSFKGKISTWAVSEDTSLEEVKAFLKSYPGLLDEGIHLLVDDSSQLMQLYGVSALPESFIFNKSGKLVKKIVGATRWDSEESSQYFQNLINE